MHVPVDLSIQTGEQHRENTGSHPSVTSCSAAVCRHGAGAVTHSMCRQDLTSSKDRSPLYCLPPAGREVSLLNASSEGLASCQSSECNLYQLHFLNLLMQAPAGYWQFSLEIEQITLYATLPGLQIWILPLFSFHQQDLMLWLHGSDKYQHATISSPYYQSTILLFLNTLYGFVFTSLWFWGRIFAVFHTLRKQAIKLSVITLSPQEKENKKFIFHPYKEDYQLINPTIKSTHKERARK